MKKNWKLIFASAAVLVSVGSGYMIYASDHDDGENVNKERNLNLTDVYAFRGDWQGDTAAADKLVLVMNSNPRALPHTQYNFSTEARYQFHLSRAGSGTTALNTRPAGKSDIVVRVTFGEPDATTAKQAITFSLIRDGSASEVSANTDGTAITTTPLTLKDAPVNNSFKIDDKTIQLFAGLRQDTFFFDVQGFFEWRAFAASNSAASAAGALSMLTAHGDFTKGYNVNSIVVSIPIALLQSSASETIFDTWATVFVPAK